MSKIFLVLDSETSISSGVHGAEAKDTSNDIYTLIYGIHPDNIVVEHNLIGFKRQLTTSLQQQLATADYIVGHNIGFDLRYVWHTEEIKAFVLRGGKIWDTQCAEYLLTGQQHCYSSLKELQLKYLGEVEKKDRISQLYKKKIGADKIIKARTRCPRLFKLYEEYCYSDGSSTLKVMSRQWAKAKQENMLPIIELYNDYLLALTNMSCTGIVIDRDKCTATLLEFQTQQLEHLTKAQELIKPMWDDRLPAFNINSPDHKSAMLFGGCVQYKRKEQQGCFKNGNPKYVTIDDEVEICGFGVDKTLSRPMKKEGLYCTDEQTMATILASTRDETLKQYLNHQKEAMMYKKAGKTYVQAFIDLNVNGILYPNYNNTQTSTGRLSSSKPNLQNVSKRNKFGKILHNLFVAPEGWVCAQADYSQLEIWTSAWLSEDEQLTQDLLKGVDLHIVRLGYYNPEYTYEQLLGMCKTNPQGDWPSKRSSAKTVSYQMAYGAMPRKVAESTGLSLNTVETIYEQEALKYPKSFSLGDKVSTVVHKTAVLSRMENIPAAMKKGIYGSHELGGIELLPIFDKSGNIYYNKEYFRKIGYWYSKTGKKLGFLEQGRYNKFGKLQRGFVLPQFKNYGMQSTAADIQGATAYECMLYALKHPDKIKIINEVHDSRAFYINKNYLDTVLKDIKNIMEDIPTIFKRRFGLNVPFRFPIDIEYGPNFGEMAKYEI